MLVYKIDYTGLAAGLEWDEIGRTVTCGKNFEHISVFDRDSRTIFEDVVYTVESIARAVRKNRVADNVYVAVTYDYDLLNTTEIQRFVDEHKADLGKIDVGFFPEIRTSVNPNRHVSIPMWIKALLYVDGVSLNNKKEVDRFGTEYIQSACSVVVKNYYKLDDKYWSHHCLLEIEINDTRFLIKANVSEDRYNNWNARIDDPFFGKDSASEYDIADSLKKLLSFTLNLSIRNIKVDQQVVNKISELRY